MGPHGAFSIIVVRALSKKVPLDKNIPTNDDAPCAPNLKLCPPLSFLHNDGRAYGLTFIMPTWRPKLHARA